MYVSIRLKSKGFKPFLLSVAMTFNVLQSGYMYGGITGGISKCTPSFIPPNRHTGNVAMLTDAKVRKIKPLEKKTKYTDEKSMYLGSIRLVRWYALAYEISL